MHARKKSVRKPYDTTGLLEKLRAGGICGCVESRTHTEPCRHTLQLLVVNGKMTQRERDNEVERRMACGWYDYIKPPTRNPEVV